MQSLALFVCTLLDKAGLSRGNSKATVALVIFGPFQSSGSTSNQRLDWPEGVIKYLYCWTPDHHLKKHCSVFQENLDNNRIHFGNDKKVCIGPYTPGT